MSAEIHRWSRRGSVRGAIMAGLLAGALLTGGQTEPEPDPAELPRLPGMGLEEAGKSFVVREGFRIELAAGEPEVLDPVAIAFDERGRMFVAEMRGYPERREEALGRIKLLEDRDGDGRYETATVFAEGLKWPTGVVCWKGGVFVTASPDIFYFGDNDGDGVAEERRVVFTGFGAGQERLNMQALVNGLQWGPDGRIYGSTASNGGTLVRPDVADWKGVNLSGADFSFDPETLDVRRESGTAQYGLTFDDYGRRYLCSNSRHLIAVMYSWPWNEVAGLPPALVDIPVDGGAAEVFRISPVEPWRVVRTRWRVQGKVGGPVEGGGRAAGYFTAASGLTVYRGDAFPEEFRGNVFVGDVGSNLVHRKVIEFPKDRVQPVARRAAGEEKREFLASTDTWFRPVQCANGPDGALYIVDMYRETIEHPWSIPESIKKHLDLYSGNDRGRIWRVVPEGFVRPVAGSLPSKVMDLLASKNGWARDTGARLLFEQRNRDPAALTMWMDRLVNLGRKSIDPAMIASLIADPDPRVRFSLALRTLEESVAIDVPQLAALAASPAEDSWIARTVAVAAKRRGVLSEVIAAQDRLEVALALMQAGGAGTGDPKLRPLFAKAAIVAADENAAGSERAAARWFLSVDESTPAATLWEWVDGDDAEMALLAAKAITSRRLKGWEDEVFARWDRMPPAQREIFLWQVNLDSTLTALERNIILPSEVPFRSRQLLLTYNDRRIVERAKAVLGSLTVQSRTEALAHYREALRMDGDGERGQKIFAERCAVCHEKRGDLAPIGPPTATLRNKGAPMLLENVIEPDREIAPQYVLWEVRMVDGTIHAGMIGEERATELTMFQADGTSKVIAREGVERLTNLNRSLMPAGLEAGLSVQEMADLLAYLTGGGE